MVYIIKNAVVDKTFQKEGKNFIKNNEQKNIGVITQSDLLKAVIEGGDGE